MFSEEFMQEAGLNSEFSQIFFCWGGPLFITLLKGVAVSLL
jgi:hypothetical protein